MDSNSTMDSTNIQLDTLENEYMMVLQQYEVAYNDYITNLKQNNVDISRNSSGYTILTVNGMNDTYCRGDGWDQNGWPKSMGILTNEMCAAACDSDAGCVAYDIARPNANQEYDCYLFGNDAVAPVQDPATYGCHKKNLPPPPSEYDSRFVSLQGKTFWGTGGVKEGPAQTAEDCESMCLSDQKCTGATFNSDKQYCWARTGEGSVAAGLDSDYALIPKLRQNVMVLRQLNSQLLSINTQIADGVKKLIPEARRYSVERDEKQKELSKSYATLLVEQRELELMLKEYETLEEQLENNELYVNQQNSSVKFWLLFALIILILTFKQMTGLGGTGGLIAVVIGIIIAIYVTVNYS